MKNLVTILLMSSPTASFAHVGHLGEVLGHDHVLGAVAIGVSIALGIWSSLKGQKKPDDAECEELDTEEAQEA